MRREIISAFQRNRPHVKIPTRTRVMAQNVTKTVNRALRGRSKRVRPLRANRTR